MLKIDFFLSYFEAFVLQPNVVKFVTKVTTNKDLYLLVFMPLDPSLGIRTFKAYDIQRY